MSTLPNLIWTLNSTERCQLHQPFGSHETPLKGLESYHSTWKESNCFNCTISGAERCWQTHWHLHSIFSSQPQALAYSCFRQDFQLLDHDHSATWRHSRDWRYSTLNIESWWFQRTVHLASSFHCWHTELPSQPERCRKNCTLVNARAQKRARRQRQWLLSACYLSLSVSVSVSVPLSPLPLLALCSLVLFKGQGKHVPAKRGAHMYKGKKNLRQGVMLVFEIIFPLTIP